MINVICLLYSILQILLDRMLYSKRELYISLNDRKGTIIKISSLNIQKKYKMFLSRINIGLNSHVDFNFSSQNRVIKTAKALSSGYGS